VNNIKKDQFHFLLIFLLIITVIIVTFINHPNIYGDKNSISSLTVTEGISSGDVTPDSAIIWSRVNKPSIMHVEFANNSLFLNSTSDTKWIDHTTDFTGKIKLNNLSAATKYFYRVLFSTPDSNLRSSSIIGTFKTAPSTSISENSLSFIVGGDIGGQTFCRELNTGYSIFEKMTKLTPDFYIQNGDMIYADDECPKQRLDGSQNIPGNFFGIADPQVNWIIKHKFMIFILNIGFTTELILICRTFSKIQLCIANGMIMRFLTTLEQIGLIGIMKTKIERDIRI